MRTDPRGTFTSCFAAFHPSQTRLLVPSELNINALQTTQNAANTYVIALDQGITLSTPREIKLFPRLDITVAIRPGLLPLGGSGGLLLKICRPGGTCRA